MYDEKVSIVEPIILLHAHSLFRMTFCIITCLTYV